MKMISFHSYFEQGAGMPISNIVLAGVTFIEGLVAGLILTFIWLQILKDRRSTKS